VRNTINSLARADEQPYEERWKTVRLSMRALAEHLGAGAGTQKRLLGVGWVFDRARRRDRGEGKPGVAEERSAR